MANIVTKDGIKVFGLCRNNNINYNTFLRHFNICGDVETALEHAREVRGKKDENAVKYRYKGQTISKLCGGHHTGLYQRVRNSIAKDGMSVEEALIKNMVI